ncbi:MAG TPA: GNAT family N-acetyltransferase [Rhodanobacteraceae bacterium]|nr:GNAT family N-acetyltransferase [Rhodanobacteraceae bacterium]
MAVAIRDVNQRDLDAVLALNNGAGPGILPLNREALRWFHDHASYFRVAEVDRHLAGFLIALREGTDYRSPNYRWFASRYERFVYIDRIVVASSQRGAGLGRVFYSDVQSYAEVRVPVLACEVFLEPRNDAVLLFHGTFGFQEVGQHPTTPEQPPVSLLRKPLPAFEFVAGQYLRDGGQLPDLPWLRERTQAASTDRATGTA